MEEHIGESRDGDVARVEFEVVVGGLPSATRSAAGWELPAAQAGGIAATRRASGAPRSPVGRTRVSPTVSLPDHNKCHTARSPSMGRIGTTRTDRSSGIALPLFRHATRKHQTIDPRLPSSVAKYPPPVVRPAIRFERPDFATTRGLRQHHRVTTVPFSPWVMGEQMNGRSRVPGANAPVHDTPPNP